MKQRSLSLQLKLIFSVSVVLIMSLQWFLVTYSIQRATRLYIQSRLEHDAESLIAALNTHATPPQLDVSRLNPTFGRPFSGHYYHLQIAQSDFESHSLWNFDLGFQSGQGKQVFELNGPQSQQLLAYQQVIAGPQNPIQLVVAEDLSLLNSQLKQFNLNYGLFSLLVLILLWLAQQALLQLVLKPLKQVQQALSHLEQGQELYLNEQTVIELQSVVKAINGLLALQHQRLLRLRNSLGDLSHALKRPLSRIQQLLEERPWPELDQELAQISLQIEHQLKRAHFAGSHALLKKIKLRDVIQDLAGALSKLYSDKELSFSLNCSEKVLIKMDHQDAMELFGNLLDNAAKWARQHITIAVIEGPESLEIQVSDDGPGVPAELLDQLTQRGLRADQQVPGHGLGLAIVQDILEVYGGHLSFRQSMQSKEQGLIVSILLPQG